MLCEPDPVVPLLWKVRGVKHVVMDIVVLLPTVNLGKVRTKDKGKLDQYVINYIHSSTQNSNLLTFISQHTKLISYTELGTGTQ